jgi:hypothetical protein
MLLLRGTYQYNEQVDGHVDDRAANKHTEVLTNILNVEGEEVRQDQEEDTDRCKLDQECDNLHHDLLNFSDSAKEGGVGTLDQASNHDSRHENSQ